MIAALKSNNIDILAYGLQEFQSGQRDYFLRKAQGAWGIYPLTKDRANHLSENSIIWDKSKFGYVSGGAMPGFQNASGIKDKNGHVIPKGQKFTSVISAAAPSSTVRKTGGQNNRTAVLCAQYADPAQIGKGDNSLYRYTNALAHLEFVKKLQQEEGLPVFFTGDFNASYVNRPVSQNGHAYMNKNANMTYCIMTRDRVMYDAYDLFRKRAYQVPEPVPNR